MDCDLKKFFNAAAFLAVVFFLTNAFALAADKQVDPAKQAAWEAAQADAVGKVSDFDAAVRSGSSERIRKTGLELQADPIAVQVMNQTRPDLVGEHNQVTNKIKNAAKGNIKDNMANEWNKAHPNDPPITRNDVEIYEPTNYKDPNAKPKSGQDWDVTVRVKGKDVPSSQSQKVVEKSYYDAAGGEKTFGKRAAGVTKEQAAAAAAHKQAVETTHGKSPEAYTQPDVILGAGGNKPDAGKSLLDPEQLTHAVENKSNQSRNKAEKAAAEGNMTEAATQEFEQMRQASKQYDKITKPRVEASGGKVNAKVDEGMDVLRDAGAGKISPEQARAKLAQMGETTESLIGKASGQSEAAQKLKSSPKEPVSVKSKALEAAGTAMTGIDIGSTAEDVKEDLKKGDLGGAATVVGEAAANQVTGGGYGTVKATKEKYDDLTEAEKQIAIANKQNEAAYNLQVEKELRKAGVDRKEVKKIMDARVNGDDSVLEGKLKELGIKTPEKVVEQPVTGDDTAIERTVAIGTGVVDNAKKTGKFVKEAAQDVTEIGTGLLEKGVASEVVGQTKENISDGYEAYKESREADRKIVASEENVKARLIAKGATPEGAQKAMDAFINGDPSMLRKLNKLLDDKNKKNAAPDTKSAGPGWGGALSSGLESLKAAAAKGGDAVKSAYDKYKTDAEKAEKEKAVVAKKVVQEKTLKEKAEAAKIEAELDAEFPRPPAVEAEEALDEDVIKRFSGVWTGRFDFGGGENSRGPVTVTFSISEEATHVIDDRAVKGTATVDGLLNYIQTWSQPDWWYKKQGHRMEYADAKTTFTSFFSRNRFTINNTPLVTEKQIWIDGPESSPDSRQINIHTYELYMWGEIRKGILVGEIWFDGGKGTWEAHRN